MMDLTRKKPLFTRLNQSNSFNTASAVGSNTLHTEYSMINGSLSDPDLKLSDRSLALTDMKKSRIPRTVSVKKVTQSEIAKMNNILQLNVTDTNNSDIDGHDASSTTSKKLDRVSITKLPRSKSSGTQRPRSASLTSIEQFSVEMQPITNPAKRSAAPINHRKVNANSGVSVSEVSRRIVSTRPYNH